MSDPVKKEDIRVKKEYKKSRKDIKEEEHKEKKRRRKRKSGWDQRGPIDPAMAFAQNISSQNLLQQQLVQKQTMMMIQQQQLLHARLAVAQASQTALLDRRIYVGSLSYELTEDQVRVPFSSFGTITNIDMPKEPGTTRSKGFCFIEYTIKESADAALQTMNGFTLNGRQIKVGRPKGTGQSNPLPVLSMHTGNAMNAGMLGMNMAATVGQVPSFLHQALARPTNQKLTLAAAQQIGRIPGSSNNDQTILNPLSGNIDPLRFAQLQKTTHLQHNNRGEQMSNNKRIYVGSIYWDLTSDHIKAVFEAFGPVTSVELINNPETGKHKGYGFVEFATSKGADDAIANMNGFELCGRSLRVGRAHISSVPTKLDQSTPTALPSPHPLLTPVGNNKPETTDRSKSFQTRAEITKKLQESRLKQSSASRLIVLKNMVASGEVDSELKRETKEECAIYGTVERVRINENKQKKTVCIYVLFERTKEAIKAKDALDKRWFGGKLVSAEFYDINEFNKGHLD